MFNKNYLIVLTKKTRRFLLITSIIILAVCILFSAVVYNLCFAQKVPPCIIIDPGHGGPYTGLSDNNLLTEKDVNLQLANKLREQLELKGMKVELTREADEALDNTSSAGDMEARTEIFNNGKYGLFISLHVNQSTSESDMGCMVLYSGSNQKNVLFAQCLQSRLNTFFKKTYDVSSERPPLKSSYPLLKDANIPGVLVETGFISNSAEKRLLQDPLYQGKLIKQIVRGIEDYLKNSGKIHEKSGTPAEKPGEETKPFSDSSSSRLVKNIVINR